MSAGSSFASMSFSGASAASYAALEKKKRQQQQKQQQQQQQEAKAGPSYPASYASSAYSLEKEKEGPFPSIPTSSVQQPQKAAERGSVGRWIKDAVKDAGPPPTTR